MQVHLDAALAARLERTGARDAGSLDERIHRLIVEALEARATDVDPWPLISGLVHEIRTPLASVMMTAELLAAQPAVAQDAAGSRYAKAVERAADDIAAVLDSVQALAHLRTGRIGLRLEEVPLRAVLEELDRHYGEALSPDDPRLAIELSQRAPRRLVTDRAQLVLVLRALADRALATTPDPVVTLAVDAEESDDAVFSVAEPGLAEGEAEALFQPFGGRSGVRTIDGRSPRGLDLVVARVRAARLGGDLEAKIEDDRCRLVLRLAADRLPARGVGGERREDPAT